MRVSHGGLQLSSASGILLILLYCTFTFVSWLFYPYPYSPWSNYLSRLGNFDYSPIGAYFYNLGCILTGIALIPFFIGMWEWSPTNALGKGVLLLGQVMGMCSVLALILIGVFSEDQGSPHMIASSAFFLLNFFVLVLISIALLLHHRFIKLIGLFGLVLTFLSLPLEVFLGGPFVEWYTVFGSLIFVGLVSYNTMLLGKDERESHGIKSLELPRSRSSTRSQV